MGFCELEPLGGKYGNWKTERSIIGEDSQEYPVVPYFGPTLLDTYQNITCVMEAQLKKLEEEGKITGAQFAILYQSGMQAALQSATVLAQGEELTAREVLGYDDNLTIQWSKNLTDMIGMLAALPSGESASVVALANAAAEAISKKFFGDNQDVWEPIT